jgi:uncharacterized protein YciI
MPANADEEVAELPVLKKRLFVALTKTRARPEDLVPFVAEHLAHMSQLEGTGRLLASGPFVQESILAGDGLTHPQIVTIEDADALIQADPLIRRGLRQFDLRPWELREGRMTITLNASTNGFQLDGRDVL